MNRRLPNTGDGVIDSSKDFPLHVGFVYKRCRSFADRRPATGMVRTVNRLGTCPEEHHLRKMRRLLTGAALSLFSPSRFFQSIPSVGLLWAKLAMYWSVFLAWPG